jgi:hypothetical protein
LHPARYPTHGRKYLVGEQNMTIQAAYAGKKILEGGIKQQIGSRLKL